MKTRQDVIDVISKVQHPAIAYSLLDLGMVKDIEIENNEVKVTFVFPFPNIPIADQLINSIAQPIKSIDLDMKYTVVIMTEDEKQKFLQMETEAWKG